MDSRAQFLKEISDQLFTQKSSLLLLWQELAYNFYPERADFTYQRSLGEDFAGDLSTSYPIIARRDLGNSLSSMLRPTQQEWFHMGLKRKDLEDLQTKRWLEWATGVQRRAMYDVDAKFVRATKEGDHDFATFGQAVISVETNEAHDTLLYRTWHLRDVAWKEDLKGDPTSIYRRWCPTALDLTKMFPESVAPQVKDLVINDSGKDKYKKVNCLHVIIPTDEWEAPAGERRPNTPFMSIYIDTDNEHIIKETGSFNHRYVIPRWQTVSGSQYAYSPATVAALPDARLIQAITYTLLEAGEKSTNPPMIATKGSVKSSIEIFAGGTTWVDQEYDERLGAAIRPIAQDYRGLPVGMEMQRDSRMMISEAFYLNKLSLPPSDHEMTAFETGQRIQEYIRQAMPLFEPMEDDYNGAICNMTFDVLMRHGAFGYVEDMPAPIRKKEVEYTFESPLHDAIERQKGQVFLEAKAMLAEAAAIDQSNIYTLNSVVALRDVLNGIGVSPAWIRSEDEAKEMAEGDEAKAQAAEAIAGLDQAGQAAKAIGEGSQAIAEAGIAGDQLVAT